jgi:hypothetical protein
MQRPCLKGREALVEETDEDGRKIALSQAIGRGGARSGADSGTRVITSSGPNDSPRNEILTPLAVVC